MIKFFTAGSIFAVLLFSALAEDKKEVPAKETETVKKSEKKPLTAEEKAKLGNLIVTSKHLDYDHVNSKAVFIRDVKAINGDTVMTAEKMTCYFDEKNDPYLIIAEGTVVIIKGKNRAEAEKGVYKINEEIIILKHQPKLFDGKNTIKARIITFYEALNISEFEDPDCTMINNKKKPAKAEDKKPAPKDKVKP